MKDKRLWIMALALALVLALLPARQVARANTYAVTNANDVGLGTLRQAIADANGNPGPDTIEFNIPVSGNCNSLTGVCAIYLNSPLPALTDNGTTIDGYTQPGASEATATTLAVLRIEIDGSSAGAGADGLTITSANNMIKGLAIGHFSSDGISISGSGATGNIVSGNYIGTDASGTTDLRNDYGIVISGGAHGNTVGGDAPGERNVISGNGNTGVYISGSGATGNTVSGNYIGTDANGTAYLGNYYYGVRVYAGAQDNTIGGDTPGERNVISGNGNTGVYISGSGTTGNTVSGNYIGTDANGTAGLSNAWGVEIQDNAQHNTVGGDAPGERNVISGNDYDGVYIYGSGTTGNTVSGNYIGTDASGTADLGNGWDGVYIDGGAQSNTIGLGNVIAYNSWGGVEVGGSDTTGNTITQNSIFSNTLGIDLVDGANGGIHPPVIVTTTVGSVNVMGTACPNCTVEVFENGDTDGEGETYMGDAAADSSGAFTVTVSSLRNPYLTATATDAFSGTSEFSMAFTATVPGPIYLPIALKNYAYSNGLSSD